jgi:hypothetical protein
MVDVLISLGEYLESPVGRKMRAAMAALAGAATDPHDHGAGDGPEGLARG